MLYVPPKALVPSHVIRDNPSQVTELTAKGNLVAIVTDGSAVLGLGDIGPQAGLPVMEGKAVLFQTLAGVEAFPICLASRDPDEIVETVITISPSFGGINLEDIAAPRCFEIEDKLRERLDMPVFHDDQHGTAIVVLAGPAECRPAAWGAASTIQIVINGAGAAGVAVARLLNAVGAADVIVCDRKGAIHRHRDGLDTSKTALAEFTNLPARQGCWRTSCPVPTCLSVCRHQERLPRHDSHHGSRSHDLCPGEPDSRNYTGSGKERGGFRGCHRTQRFPQSNQQFAGIPRGIPGGPDVRARTISDEMKIAAAHAIADLVLPDRLSPEFLIPDSLDLRVAPRVAAAVARTAQEQGLARDSD